MACIEGVSPFDFDEAVSEGRIHPIDRSDGSSRVTGRLRYESNPESLPSLPSPGSELADNALTKNRRQKKARC